jgi:hypothetical protein
LSTEQETWVNTYPFHSNTHFVPTGRNHFVRARRQNKMSAADTRYLVQLWFLFCAPRGSTNFAKLSRKKYWYTIIRSFSLLERKAKPETS